MMLVTLEQASDHVRRDTDADDADLELKIRAASGAVLRYLDGSSYGSLVYDPATGKPAKDSDGQPIYERDSNGDVLVHPTIQEATLLLVADAYTNREPTAKDAVPERFGYGYLPRVIVALLYPFRKPVLA